MHKGRSALIIFASPHKNGFTSNALKDFLSLHPEIKDITFVRAYKKNVRPCSACGYCITHDGCMYNDMNDIDISIRTVDIIIFATPVYNLSVPSPMKAIFDRMQRYYSSRFFRNNKPVIPKSKQGVLIITCGSNDDFGIEVVRKQVKLVSSIINCSVSKEIIIKQTDILQKNSKEYERHDVKR